MAGYRSCKAHATSHLAHSLAGLARYSSSAAVIVLGVLLLSFCKEGWVFCRARVDSRVVEVLTLVTVKDLEFLVEGADLVVNGRGEASCWSCGVAIRRAF